MNEKSDIIHINLSTNKTQKIASAERGISYGTKMLRKRQILLFMNSELGLCQYDIVANQVLSLVSSYNNEPLRSLNSIEVDAKNPHIIYFTQVNPNISMT